MLDAVVSFLGADPDGAMAVNGPLAEVWRLQNPETGLFPAAVLEGVRDLAAADAALAAETAGLQPKRDQQRKKWQRQPRQPNARQRPQRWRHG